MTERRVLVVDDETVLAGVVANYLNRAGFAARTCDGGERAVAVVKEWSPEVAILDLGLPDVDGIEVCRRIRTFSTCYIIMLTARDEESDKLDGLSVGADDYVTKPFSVRELVARVQAVLRRPRTDLTAPEARVFGRLTIDVAGRTALLDDEPVDLTRTEFDLLDAIAARPGSALTRRQLMDEVWGETWVGDDHVVDVHIGKIRKKLREDPVQPRYIITVRGVGYKMGTGS